MTISLLAMDADSGRATGELLPDAPMIPASCAKLLTAATALITLGPEHRSTTTVALLGDRLFLRGGGEPSMEPQDLARLAAQTAGALSRPVTVHIDETRYPPFTPASGWAADYLPVEVQPVVPLTLREYFGHDPGRAAGEALAGSLSMLGLDARFAGPAATPATARVVGRARSRRIADQVVHMLHSSHNLTAEVLHREAALATGGAATWEAAGITSIDALRTIGLPTRGLVRADGSGLSIDNRTSARLLVELLRRVHLDQAGLGEIRDALPLAGITGTMSAINDWFQQPPGDRARGYLRAKPGTLREVVTLAGITAAPGRRRRVFAILSNGPADKRQVERMAAQIAFGDSESTGDS